MKIMVSNICHAFDNTAVGSKVHPGGHSYFMDELEKVILDYDFSVGNVPGQAVVNLPEKVNSWVSPGTWFRSNDPKDYVVREYRGAVGMFMKRHSGMESHHVSCVVYTKAAYEADPDFTQDEAVVVNEFFGKGNGYVLVAVLGDCDLNKSTVSYSRFVKNFAGANNEYLVMEKPDLVRLAMDIDKYRGTYCGVAD